MSLLIQILIVGALCAGASALVHFRRPRYEQLTAVRPWVAILNLVLGAILTTPQVLTQILLACVLQGFYEFFVWRQWSREPRVKAVEKAGQFPNHL